MSDPLGTASYVLMTPDGDLANSRTLTADSSLGVTFNDFGPGGNVVFGTVGALEKINDLGSNGIVVGLASSPYFTTRSITSNDNSLTVTNGDGTGGNIDLSLGTGQSVQLINFEYNGAGEGTGTTLNLVPGSGINISPSFDGSSKIMSYTLSSSTHGTVTSVALTSTSGLTITGSPITSSGAFTVNLPTGLLHQQLRIASINPQVLEFVTPSGGAPTDSYYLCQLGTDLPSPNGINLGQANAILGIGIGTPTYSLDILNSSARVSHNYVTSHLVSNTAGDGADFGGVLVDTYGAYSGLFLRNSAGTYGSTNPLATPSGAILGLMAFAGNTSNGSATFLNSALIQAKATQAFTSSHAGTRLDLQVTPNNTVSPVIALSIDQTGFVGIGNVTPATTLDLYSANILSTPFSGLCALNVVTDALAGNDIPGYSYFTNYGGTGASNAGSNIVLAGARGNKAAPRRIFDGDIVASLSVVGAHAVDNSTNATFSTNPTGQIQFVAYGDDFSSTSQPTAISFLTTPGGSTTPVQKAILDPSGLFGLNVVAPSYQLDVHSNHGASHDFSVAHLVADGSGDSQDFGGLILESYNAHSNLSLRSSPGSFASPTHTTVNEILGELNFGGNTSDGTATFANSAGMYATATQDFTGSHLGTKLQFYVTHNDSSVGDAALLIEHTGFVGIGAFTPDRALMVYNVIPDPVVSTDYTSAHFISDTISSSDFGGIYVDTYSSPSSVIVRSALGNYLSGSQISNGSILGGFEFAGYTGAGAFTRTAKMVATATQDYTSATHVGSSLGFYVTPNSTNPSADVPNLFIDQTGYVGINNITPRSALVVYTNTPDASNANDYTVGRLTADATGTYGTVFGGLKIDTYGSYTGLSLRAGRGTSTGTAPIQSSDILGQLFFAGNTVTNANPTFLNSAYITATATEIYSSSAIGSKLSFFTTKNTTNTPLEVLKIDQTGFVGIGSSIVTPAYQLDVYTNNSTAAFHGVVESTIGSFTGPIFDSFVGSHTTGSYTLLRGARGTQASATHTVSGDVFGGVFAYGNGNTSTGIATFIGGAGVQFTALEDFNNGTTSAGTEVQILSVPTGSVIATTTMTLKQSSSTNSLVGIGTTSPLYNLDIYSASTATGIMIHTVGDNSALSNTGIIVDSYTGTHSGGGYLSMRSSRGTSGAVTPTLVNDIIGGINVYGNSVTGSGAAFGNSTAALNFNALETFAAGSNSGTNCTITTTKIATNTPGISMYVAGGATTNAQVSIGMAPGSKMLELLSDSAQKPGVGGLWTVTPCDERVKTEIDHIDGGKALAKIKAMIPRTYKFTPEYVAHRENLLNANAEEGAERIPSDVSADDIQHGFVAQELAAVFPEAVVDSTTQVGTVENLKGVNLGLPLIMLFKAFQELTTKVEALEAQLAAK